MVVPPPVARTGTQQMVPAVALKKRIPKPQLCQRLREDCSGWITSAIIVAFPRTPSISRAVSSAVQLLSIVYLAFQSHHMIVSDFRDGLPHQATQVRGKSLAIHNVRCVKVSIVEANARCTRPSWIVNTWSAVGKILELRPPDASGAMVCNTQQLIMRRWRRLQLPLNDIPWKDQV